MIAYLQGIIKKKLPKSIILNTGKIGYLIHTTHPLWEKIKEKNELELYIYTKVRDDDISLYGFETLGELEFFKTLLNVNGIGTKLALEILSQDIELVKTALIGADTFYLSKIPGIGKKTAERLIVELKNKIDLLDIKTLHTVTQNKIDEDAIAAIMSLGYQKFEIHRTLKNLPVDIKNTEDIITFFLQHI